MFLCFVSLILKITVFQVKNAIFDVIHYNSLF
jgi:hypothetical protein